MFKSMPFALGLLNSQHMNTLFQQRTWQQGCRVNDIQREYLNTTGLGRMVYENYVAEMVAYLGSSQANNITSQAIDVTTSYRL